MNEINLRISISKSFVSLVIWEKNLTFTSFYFVKGLFIRCALYSNDHLVVWRATQFRHDLQPSSWFYKNANVRRKDRFIFLACLLTFFPSPYSSYSVLSRRELRCSLQNLIRTLGGCLHESFFTLLIPTMNETQLACHFSYLFAQISCYPVYHDFLQLMYL